MDGLSFWMELDVWDGMLLGRDVGLFVIALVKRETAEHDTIYLGGCCIG
jgi:hypothetical protein